MIDPARSPAGLIDRCNTLPGNVRGALWMLLGSAIFTAQSAIVKGLGARLDSFEIAFFRCAFGLLAIAPFVIGPYLAQGGAALFLTGRPWMHLARALVGAARHRLVSAGGADSAARLILHRRRGRAGEETVGDRAQRDDPVLLHRDHRHRVGRTRGAGLGDADLARAGGS